ncbi:MAG: endolytic transglycosylase MltG [Bacteroidaceae bacterium]|nr:endolytic transglycosylase MltG [Bacteroidaceae bacterium]
MNRKHLIALGVSLFVIFVAIGIGGYVAYDRFFTPAFHIASTARLYIDADDTPDSVSHKVHEVLSPKHPEAFDWLMKHEEYTHVQTGSYLFDPTDNLRTAIRRLKLGWQSPVRLVVPSVRTIDRLAQALSKQLMLSEQKISDTLSCPAYRDSLGYTAETLPALFIPNTYEVYWDIPVEKLMQRFQKEYNAYWTTERQKKAAAQGLSPIEVATLASIVDEETAVNSEKPIVAGLYLNRLRRGMLLQADPTVKFATGDPTLRRILNKHLTIDSPYNTYIYEGLPPGPIRIPSMSALEAVLNPARHNYLYMCAKEDFSGTHNFATTLAQHNANARRYQQALNRRGIK